MSKGFFLKKKMHEIRKTELNTNHATFTTFNVSLDNRKTGMISMTKVFPQSWHLCPQ